MTGPDLRCFCCLYGYQYGIITKRFCDYLASLGRKKVVAPAAMLAVLQRFVQEMFDWLIITR